MRYFLLQIQEGKVSKGDRFHGLEQELKLSGGRGRQSWGKTGGKTDTLSLEVQTMSSIDPELFHYQGTRH